MAAVGADNAKKRKHVEPDDLPNWNLPEVFTWASDMTQQKCRSPAFLAAGETWVIVRSSCMNHQRQSQVSLSFHSTGPVTAGPEHNAVQLRLLFANPASPGHSIVREKTYSLSTPQRCVLSAMMLLEEVMDPASGWIMDGALQVRAMVRTLMLDDKAGSAAGSLGGASTVGDVMGEDGDMGGVENVDAAAGGGAGGIVAAVDALTATTSAAAADTDTQPRAKRQAKGPGTTTTNNSAGANGTHATPRNSPPNNNSNNNNNNNNNTVSRLLLPSPAPSPLPLTCSLPPNNQQPALAQPLSEAMMRANCIMTLNPMVKKLAPAGGPTRAEVWEAVTQRLNLVEVQLVCAVGIQLLNDEWKDGKGDDKARDCSHLMRTMLRMPHPPPAQQAPEQQLDPMD